LIDSSDKLTIRVGVITVSDRAHQGTRADQSGPELITEISRYGWRVVRQIILPDEFDQLVNVLTEWADRGDMDIILTTGGTGFSPRDITPEATQAVIQRPTPGLAEAMRSASLSITPHAMLSRATAGIRAQTLIVNLPGSPKGAVENLAVLAPALPHAVQLLRADPAAEAGHRQK
jgi:molybdopterin adenylyltransferase